MFSAKNKDKLSIAKQKRNHLIILSCYVTSFVESIEYYISNERTKKSFVLLNKRVINQFVKLP